MTTHLNLASPDLEQIDREMRLLRQEIALARQKRAGIDAAIDNRMKALSRHEARRAMIAQSLLPAPVMGGR